MTLQWHHAETDPPPVDVPVIGWWARNSIASVVLRSSGWHRPGYYYSETYCPPVLWCHEPEIPNSGRIEGALP